MATPAERVDNEAFRRDIEAACLGGGTGIRRFRVASVHDTVRVGALRRFETGPKLAIAAAPGLGPDAFGVPVCGPSMAGRMA